MKIMKNDENIQTITKILTFLNFVKFHIKMKVAGVFGAFVGRPDGFGSSDFVRIEIFLCSIDLSGSLSLDFK